MIIKRSQDEIQNYLVDASNFKGYCDAVYFPESVKEISEILMEANKNKILVTISGNGTGLTGARVPQGGIVISTEKLNKILEINTREMNALVEPGVILSEFQITIKENKLLYPPDPTERNCFIGATIATNASGEKTFKYGATREYVLELQIILPDGEILNLIRSRNKANGYELELISESGKKYKLNLPGYEMPETKNASGYFCKKDMDAIDLFIGSEGTLGVITKIKLKLVPLPYNILSCLVFFNSEEDGLSFIEKARDISFVSRKAFSENSIDALALEYFDKNSLRFLKDDYSQIPGKVKAAVWFEQELSPSDEDLVLNKWMDLILMHNSREEDVWYASNEAERKKIEEFRHSISAKVNEYISKNNLKKLGTDSAVPANHFREFYFYCKDEMEKAGLDYIIYGHFGNSHIHLNMLPKNEDEYQIGKNAYKNISKKAVKLKGTVSAEHGIGKLKTEYLLEMYGEENIRGMASLKKILDPNLILGIGNIFEKKLL